MKFIASDDIPKYLREMNKLRTSLYYKELTPAERKRVDEAGLHTSRSSTFFHITYDYQALRNIEIECKERAKKNWLSRLLD